MQCPKCKKYEMEVSSADVNLDRNGIRIRVTCSDYVCEFYKILELGIDDIIGIAKDPETEAETRAAVRREGEMD